MNNESIDNERHSKICLENYVKECKIFIDTCSILHFASEKFWTNIIPFLYKYNKKIIVPLRSVEELQKHSNDTSNLELSLKAKNSLKKIQQLIEARIIEIRGEQSDNFADNVFQVVFTKFRMNYNLLLITQDGDLAKDILRLNSSKSVKANLVQVKRINKYGFLSNFKWNTEKEKDSKFYQKNEDNDILKDNCFKICSAVTTIADSNLNISHIPVENEIVYTTSHSEIKLGTEVAAGGEGIIYTTNTPYVAKIYKKENNTRRKYEKIKLMLSKKIECDGICYPVEALCNSKNEFVGFLMPNAKGKELQKSIFIKPLFLKNFPTWKKRDTVELCITILEKIKYLHEKNIIMGDINPANILVVSPKEVYFVDTDSYQIEAFPCPVGTINYTAPEIQNKSFSTFLRTIGNENFAVATLLFMIMLPGKPPYSQQGGENPVDNIIKMDFSYPFGDNSNKKTPDGPWRYIWSHLTYDLKKAFYNTFRIDGLNSSEDKRLSVDEWISIFKYYLELLDSGKLKKQDAMSEELFPTRHKKNPNVAYITCSLCSNETPENQCNSGICRECLKKGTVYKCRKCGREILFTNYQKYIKREEKPTMCQECREYGKKVRIQKKCIDCGQLFDITNNQYTYYTSRNLELPKRCKSCREARKKAQNNSSSSGSFCFISTVICEYFKMSDSCSELNTLRKFRDTWLRNQQDGPQLISQYYNSAPVLVSKLKLSPNFAQYCQYLWDNYLHPCLEYIQNQQYESCKVRYIEMYQYLTRTLIDDEI